MTLKKAVVLRGQLTMVLESIQGYFRKCTPAVRAALFGALSDEWCVICGTEINGCQCLQIAAKHRKLRRSTTEV
jgi:hypothetical protein